MCRVCHMCICVPLLLFLEPGTCVSPSSSVQYHSPRDTQAPLSSRHSQSSVTPNNEHTAHRDLHTVCTTTWILRPIIPQHTLPWSLSNPSSNDPLYRLVLAPATTERKDSARRRRGGYPMVAPSCPRACSLPCFA